MGSVFALVASNRSVILLLIVLIVPTRGLQRDCLSIRGGIRAWRRGVGVG